MNKKTTEKLKKTGILSGIFIAAVLILWGVSYLGFILKEDTYIKAANTVFTHSPLCLEYRNLKIIKNSKENFMPPNFCNAFFRADHHGKIVYVLFVNMTGKYGIYQGVFICCFNENGGGNPKAEFCGLAGNIDLAKQPDYYGITPIIIKTIQTKIECSFQNIHRGELHNDKK